MRGRALFFPLRLVFKEEHSTVIDHHYRAQIVESSFHQPLDARTEECVIKRRITSCEHDPMIEWFPTSQQKTQMTRRAWVSARFLEFNLKARCALNHAPYPDEWFRSGIACSSKNRGTLALGCNRRSACALRYEIVDLLVDAFGFFFHCRFGRIRTILSSSTIKGRVKKKKKCDGTW